MATPRGIQSLEPGWQPGTPRTGVMEAKESGARLAGGVNHRGIVMMLGGINAYVVQHARLKYHWPWATLFSLMSG